MLDVTKTHYFRDENDNRLVVHTTEPVSGYFRADLVETTGGELELKNLFGYGSTRMEALATLQKKIEQEMS